MRGTDNGGSATASAVDGSMAISVDEDASAAINTPHGTRKLSAPNGLRARFLRSKAGFTLVEMLTAIAILALLGATVTAGIPVAIKVMQESTFASDSTLLESTVDTALADTFRYATDIHQPVGAADAKWQFNTADGKHSDVYLDVTEGYIFFVDTKGGSETLTVLVTKGAYSNLEIEDFSYTYDSSAQTFSGGYTIILSEDSSKTRSVTFAYKALYGKSANS